MAEMDEKAIVARTQPESVSEKTETTNRNENPDELGNVRIREWLPLYKYFNLDESEKHDRTLAIIWEWAKKQAPNKDRDSILFEVIKLNNRLGSTGIGENPYAKIINYITVYNRYKESEEELKRIELNGG